MCATPKYDGEAAKAEQAYKKDCSPLYAVFTVGLSEAGNFIHTYHDEVNALSTVIIAIFTVILGLFTISLSQSTRVAANSADMSARAALALELPVIQAVPVGLGCWVAQKGDLPRTEHFGLQCFEFANHGRTKAFPIEVRWGWTVGHNLPHVPVYKFSKSFDLDQLLKPDEKIGLYVNTFEMDIASGDRERITTKRTRLWMYCCLEYEDFMRTRREVGFCWIRYETFGAGGHAGRLALILANPVMIDAYQKGIPGLCRPLYPLARSRAAVGAGLGARGQA